MTMTLVALISVALGGCQLDAARPSARTSDVTLRCEQRSTSDEWIVRLNPASRTVSLIALTEIEIGPLTVEEGFYSFVARIGMV